jgi:4-amino-4-deoxy-L-arabinose transferase-like glycosyltransferase
VAYGAAAVVVAAGWWVVAVQLTPAADRPYIGGSQNNSLWNLIFGYNGFGRLTGNETGSVGGGTGGSRWGATGLTRLFGADMGSQISWLLPAALILLGTGLVLTWRTRRSDRTRAALLLWGGWLAVTGAAFSLGKGIIHPYYTVALAPAIGAIVGIGGAAAWARRHRTPVRGILAATVAVTALWAWMLMGRSPAWMPELRGAILFVGLAAAIGLLVWPWIDAWGRRAVVAAAILACLAGPAAYTIDTVATPHSGAIPSAGPAVTTSAPTGPGRGGPGFGRGAFPGGPPGGAPPGGLGGGPPGGFVGRGQAGGPGGGLGGGLGGGAAGGLLNASTPSGTLVSYLDQNASQYHWIAATVGANEAAGYQLATDRAIMAIGGFNGSDPTPTLAQFQKLVAAGQIHYFIAGAGGRAGAGPGNSGAANAITAWVEANFSASTVGGVTVYTL